MYMYINNSKLLCTRHRALVAYVQLNYHVQLWLLVQRLVWLHSLSLIDELELKLLSLSLLLPITLPPCRRARNTDETALCMQHEGPN